MPYRRRLKDKYAGSSRERICGLNYVQLVILKKILYKGHWHSTKSCEVSLSSFRQRNKPTDSDTDSDTDYDADSDADYDAGAPFLRLTKRPK